MNAPQAVTAIVQSHKHLSQLIREFNHFELTTHDWNAVETLVKNMESWFDFLPKSGVEVNRQMAEWCEVHNEEFPDTDE